MSDQEPMTDDQACSTDVEITLRADPAHLPIIRSMAATIAIREDFDMDAVEDIKLAVDEMCSTLIVRALPATKLTCRFRVSDGAVVLLVTAPSDSDRPIDQRSFGWRVLTTLTDEVTTWISPEGAVDHLVHIEMSKSRRTAVAG